MSDHPIDAERYFQYLQHEWPDIVAFVAEQSPWCGAILRHCVPRNFHYHVLTLGLSPTADRFLQEMMGDREFQSMVITALRDILHIPVIFL